MIRNWHVLRVECHLRDALVSDGRVESLPCPVRVGKADQQEKRPFIIVREELLGCLRDGRAVPAIDRRLHVPGIHFRRLDVQLGDDSSSIARCFEQLGHALNIAKCVGVVRGVCESILAAFVGRESSEYGRATGRATRNAREAVGEPSPLAASASILGVLATLLP